MDKAPKKIDPIRDKYYRPLEQAERVTNILFYVSAILSLVTPLINKINYPIIYDAVQIAFFLTVGGVFCGGLLVRLYIAPRAQEKRFQDFLSHAYGISLTHERTTGYYNNDVKDSPRRIASQLLENSFYSKDTVLQMARTERLKILAYIILFVLAVLNRSTDLGVIGLIAQIIFSEQLLSRWIRMEWIRKEFEWTYEELFRLFQSKPEPTPFMAMALELMVRYETAKANACITLSQKIFERRRAERIREWEQVKSTLSI